MYTGHMDVTSRTFNIGKGWQCVGTVKRIFSVYLHQSLNGTEEDEGKYGYYHP